MPKRTSRGISLGRAPTPRLSKRGLSFLLPAAMDRMSWLSESRWTEYPPGHIGNPTGSITSPDISFRSSKRDVHWLALSDGGKYSLVALGSGKPLHARGRVETNGIMLFLSSAIGVSRQYGSSAMPGYDIHLTPDSPVSGAFRLRVAAQLTPPSTPSPRPTGESTPKRNFAH